jgi:phospholipase/carboxylesterase
MKQGKSIAATLQHVIFLPTSAGKNFPTIIALHGRGANENDLVPLVLALELSDVMLVTPRAPFAFPYGGHAWYNLGQEGVPDPETFRTSLGLFQKFVDEVKAAYPVDSERLILLGFSQGTVIAYATALLDPSAFRGVAALSGYIPHRSGVPLQLSKLTGFPVFVSHGSNDMMMPVRFGRESAELLNHTGADVTYREYHMGHEVTEDVIRDLKKWVREILSPAQGYACMTKM